MKMFGMVQKKTVERHLEALYFLAFLLTRYKATDRTRQLSQLILPRSVPYVVSKTGIRTEEAQELTSDPVDKISCQNILFCQQLASNIISFDRANLSRNTLNVR